MLCFSRHPEGQATRLGLLGLCLTATGCQSLSSTGASARVRVIDVSPDTPAVDIYQGNAAVAYNLGFGTVTSYLPLAPGSSTITVDVAGSRQVLSSIEGSFNADAHYTVLVSNPAANLQQMILTDHGVAATLKATPSIRFIHQASRTGAVDIYLVPAGQRLTSVTPAIANLAAGSNTGYVAVPSCSCTTVILPAGTPPSTAAAVVHNGAQGEYGSGSARTVVLVDAPPAAASGVQVITTTDAEPPL